MSNSVTFISLVSTKVITLMNKVFWGCLSLLPPFSIEQVHPPELMQNSLK